MPRSKLDGDLAAPCPLHGPRRVRWAPAVGGRPGMLGDPSLVEAVLTVVAVGLAVVVVCLLLLAAQPPRQKRDASRERSREASHPPSDGG